MKALLLLDRVRLAIGCVAACCERVRLATGFAAGGEGLGTLGADPTSLGLGAAGVLVGGTVGTVGILGAGVGGRNFVAGLGSTAGGCVTGAWVTEILVLATSWVSTLGDGISTLGDGFSRGGFSHGRDWSHFVVATSVAGVRSLHLLNSSCSCWMASSWASSLTAGHL